MESLLFLVVGALLAYLILQKPLKIEVHHKYENIVPASTLADMEELEQDMLKDDPTTDKMYEELDKVLYEVNSVMGGSDR